MLLKTSELTGSALDWAVAKVLGLGYRLDDKYGPMCFRPVTTPGVVHWDSKPLPYSTDWAQGGPIIEREMVDLNYSNYQGTSGELWDAACEAGKIFGGSTPLIAAMRCFVASKLGDEVDVPEELL